MSNSHVASRPRTPSMSPVPPPAVPEQPPPLPNSQDETDPKTLQRKSSFSFLRRGKSTEKVQGIKRTTSNGKLQKKSTRHSVREPTPLPSEPPKIPDLASQPSLQGFGDIQPPGNRTLGNATASKMPEGQTESRSRPDTTMTNRERQSYPSSITSTLNHPRRVRRRKDPVPFNILIVGARNSGKSSFGEFLRTSLALPLRKQRQSHYTQDSVTAAPVQQQFNSHFQSEYLETEVAGERIGLTVWDSEGLEKSIIDLQLREIVAFIESKFHETLTEESKVNRLPGTKDPHIHCVILLLDPSNLNKTVGESRRRRETAINGDLANGKPFLADLSPETIDALNEDMDMQALRALQGKTTVVPIISKADTVTAERMSFLKRSVFQQLRASKLDPFEVLGMEEEEGDSTSESDIDEIPGHRNRNRLNEADEDRVRGSGHDGTQSRLDSESSSSAGSSILHHRGGAAAGKEYGSSPPPLPLSVMTPDPITPHEPVKGATSRDFPWGSADPYNPSHCDFTRFKEAIFEEWFIELREASRELWYEGWRTSRLNNPRAKSAASDISQKEAPLPILTAEPARHLAVTAPSAATPSVDGGRSSRNVSGAFATSPSPQPNQQPRMAPSPALQPSQQPRMTPSPALLAPKPITQFAPNPTHHEATMSPQTPSRASPHPPSGLQQQQTPQQRAQQQTSQAFQHQSSRVQQEPVRGESIDQQEVGVAR